LKDRSIGELRAFPRRVLRKPRGFVSRHSWALILPDTLITEPFGTVILD
jgi:hypothetical protein